MIRMTAKKLLNKFGNDLVGRKILTPRCGDWPESWCVVTELDPDENAPGIVFSVKNNEHVHIGVLCFEEVEISQFYR